MSKVFNFAEELREWLITNGKEKNSKINNQYYEIEWKNGKRKKLFIKLLDHLKELGAKKELFMSGPRREEILDVSVTPRYVCKSASQYNYFVKCGRGDLDDAIREVFGKDSTNGKKTKIKKSDKLSLEEKIEQEERETTVKIEEKSEEVEVKKVYPPPPPFKKFHKSMTEQEGVEPMPETEHNYDPEMRKWLGYKDK